VVGRRDRDRRGHLGDGPAAGEQHE
jgi:hypothetical protein